MSDTQKTTKDVRLSKLEAALKENLKRRKAQARARKAQSGQDGAGHEEAGEQPSGRPAGAEKTD